MSASRWLRLVTLVTLVAFALGVSPAAAQVFKPRGGKAAKTQPVAARKAAATPAATPSKKATRTPGATPRRVAAPPAKKARPSKVREEPDEVVIIDDDDDVTITDDE